MSDSAFEFIELFRDEANERLDSIVDTLLAIEAGRAEPDAVDVLFRNAHTIKGGAGMLGLDDLRALAHAVEDVLESVRDAGEFPPHLVDPLLRAADALRSHVAGESPGTPDLLEELAAGRAAILAGHGASPLEPAAAEVEPRSDAAPALGDRRGIRVSPQKIDRLLDLVGETVLHRRRLEHVIGGERVNADEAISDELGLGERLFDELKDAAIKMRTLPLATITGPLPRAVRDIAAAEGKEVELVVIGEEVELDRVILESLGEPLVHIVRNAVGHGIEPQRERVQAGKPPRGTIELRAQQRGGLIEIVIADDGRGVTAEVLAEARRVGSLVDVLTRPGFTTAAEVTELSGRGVGLDAVKTHVETFGGTLDVRSEPGKGTEILLTLPLALALLDVLLVERGGRIFGIPLGSVEEALAVDDTLMLQGRPALELRGRSVSLSDLADLLGATAPALPARAPAVVVTSGGRRAAAACDRLLGEDEVVVKPLGPLLASARGYLGAAIPGDGRIALLLDPQTLTRAAAPYRQRPESGSVPTERLAPKVLVVEDSYTVRELQRSILEAAGYRVETARDGKEGLDRVLEDDSIGLVITDLDMPEMDGLELTRAIRAHAERSSLPIVVVTSKGDEADRVRGIDAGADAYMIKRAFDQQTLLDTVERLVGR
ncbi:MAG TPA: response regulator [Gaiellaceae bacterium]|nr:response regulator [Gaiellaceae bacterium]